MDLTSGAVLPLVFARLTGRRGEVLVRHRRERRAPVQGRQGRRRAAQGAGTGRRHGQGEGRLEGTQAGLRVHALRDPRRGRREGPGYRQVRRVGQGLLRRVPGRQVRQSVPAQVHPRQLLRRV